VAPASRITGASTPRLSVIKVLARMAPFALLLAAAFGLVPIIQSSDASGFHLAFSWAPLAMPNSAANGFPSGSLHGSVRIESKIQPRSLAVNLYSRRGGLPIPPKASTSVNELENVVLYLEGDFKAVSSQPRHLEGENLMIRQVDETFVPHVLPIQAGTTVHFPNGDPFFHNVFSLSGAKSFDLGRYPKNEVRSVKFDRAGIVKVFCHIHSHMNAVVLILDHPYFCVADAKGAYSMSHLPVGQHTLVAWHERLKPQKKSVHIQPVENRSVDFVL
jgi:plastocyanin